MDVWTDEWDQERATRRSIETMLRIAQEAEKFADDEGAAYEACAKRNKLTVNEIVYYLNAYEAGGIDGLQAIRNPDITQQRPPAMPSKPSRKAWQSILAIDYRGASPMKAPPLASTKSSSGWMAKNTCLRSASFA